MNVKEERELVGVKEIARRANVSIATVDRVLHNRSGVSLKTKEKITAIIKELNYQPNIFAQRLSSKKVTKIAVLIPQSSSESSFWDAPLEGIKKAGEEINQYGINIDIFHFDQNSIQSFERKAKLILEQEYGGVLLAPMFIDHSRDFLHACKEKNIPFVLINSDIPDQDSLCYFGPNLYKSGYMVGHLLGYLLNDEENVLLVNISKEIDTHHHLLRKEEGFRAYFNDTNRSGEVYKVDVRNTDYPSVKKHLDGFFDQDRHVRAIFVTNSRVSAVAQYVEERNLPVLLIGFDFLPKNLEYLKKNTIDFLICQKPNEQGYKGIMALCHKLLYNINPSKTNFMPIDIVTRENYMFYEPS